MIKRLRIRFVSVTMALMAVLLQTIMLMICYNTWYEMDKEASEALRSATFEPWQPGGMGAESPNPNYPCFILYVDHFGELHAVGHSYYDLSNQAQLQQILQEAKDTGKSGGYLADRCLRFEKIELWKMEEYVFTNICHQFCAIRSLVWTCFAMFFLGMALFFAVSILLSKWMVRPLERAWEQQRQFVSDASHELKTPLTVILTNAELLEENVSEDPNCRRFSGAILTMAHQMKGLVENLLELARVENPRAKPQKALPLSISDLADECVMSFEPVYFEAGRTLESRIQPGLRVAGQEGQLRQVVDILLDNGTKYSSPGTEVWLTLEQSRSHALLKVASQGESLSAKQCKDVFKRFYRVDEVRSMNHSYGLGLPIAMSIVTEHKGRMWCQSKDGVNTFCVSLPLYDRKK